MPTTTTTNSSQLDTRELQELVAALFQPTALIELGMLVVCMAIAWALVRLLRGKEVPPGSIWFGERVVDGVLFPVFALVLAFGARVLLRNTMHAAVFKLAVPILISLVVIRITVRVLQASFPNLRWMRVIEHSVSWAAWAAVILWVTGILPFVLDAMDDVSWKIGATPITLRNMIEGTLTGGLVILVALWISSAIEKRLLHGSGQDLSIRKIAANLVRVLLLFVGLMFALSAVGIDLTALSVLGGALGVGIGFGLQKIAANYISGFVILAERSVRIGDMVKVDSFEGRITDIRTRYTVIRSLAGREALVPNEMLITQRVENLSLADPRVSITCTVQVAYGTDVRALQPVIVTAVTAVRRVLADPGPTCQLAAFSADGIDLNIGFWISDPESGQGNVRSDVNLAVLDVLNSLGIEIPFPQRVLHGMPEAAAPQLPESADAPPQTAPAPAPAPQPAA